MKKSNLTKHVMEDKEDEEKDVKKYGKRKSQHPKLKGMFGRMQKDEEKHEGNLDKIGKSMVGPSKKLLGKFGMK